MIDRHRSPTRPRTLALVLGMTLAAGGCKSAFVASPENQAAWRRAQEVLDPNADSNFGGETLRTGFTPDPWTFRLTAGGGRHPVNVADLAMVDALTGFRCGQSFVTRRPDFHFRFESGVVFSLLRFYVITANGSDATMIINQPNGQWRCNDDHARGGWGNPTMPAIDFISPAPGRYDIWVGSFDASSHNDATLYVTELDANHP